MFRYSHGISIKSYNWFFRLTVNSLNRSHLFSNFTCQAHNTELVDPKQVSLILDLNCKYIKMFLNVWQSPTYSQLPKIQHFWRFTKRYFQREKKKKNVICSGTDFPRVRQSSYCLKLICIGALWLIPSPINRMICEFSNTALSSVLKASWNCRKFYFFFTVKKNFNSKC